jgi:hypothetical protein
MASCIVSRDTPKSAAASGNTGTRICIARIPVEVTVTRIQKGVRPLRARAGVLSQPRCPNPSTFIQFNLASLAFQITSWLTGVAEGVVVPDIVCV